MSSTSAVSIGGNGIGFGGGCGTCCSCSGGGRRRRKRCWKQLPRPLAGCDSGAASTAIDRAYRRAPALAPATCGTHRRSTNADRNTPTQSRYTTRFPPCVELWRHCVPSSVSAITILPVNLIIRFDAARAAIASPSATLRTPFYEAQSSAPSSPRPLQSIALLYGSTLLLSKNNRANAHRPGTVRILSQLRRKATVPRTMPNAWNKP